MIDNPVVMSWCFEDECNTYANAVLESLNSAKAFMPAVWPLEVGNVLLVAERKRHLTKAAVIRFLALLSGLPITTGQETPERMLKEIISIARDQGLSTHDASYLDFAMRFDLPIATLDAPILRAAKRCNVPTFHPTRS